MSAAQPIEMPCTTALPGVTIAGLDLDRIEPTPENSVLVDVMPDDWPSVDAVVEALNAGKLVWWFYAPEPRAQFGLGRLRPGVVTLFDVDGGRSTFADVRAAMEQGLRAIGGLVHE